MIRYFKHIVRRRPLPWLAALFLLASASSASADMTCRFKSGSAYQTATGPLPVAQLTVGRDLPVGSILANQSISGYSAAWVTCSGGTNRNLVQTVEVQNNSLQLSAWQPTGEAAGRIYQTNLPGVGVMFYGTVPSNFPPQTWTTTQIANPIDIDAKLGVTQAVLVKVGDITPGVVNTIGWPTISYIHGGLRLWTFTFSGSTQFISRTCTTPNQLVPLGDRPLSDFSGPGTGSPLVDFVIEFKDCPQFAGKRRDSTQFYTHTYGRNAPLANIVPDPPVPNTMRFRLVPTASDIVSPGIMKLGAPADGFNSATGVGIEVRRRGASTPVAFNTWLDGLSLLNVADHNNQTIPFSARYVQLAGASVVTPGQGRGSMEFIIEYQ